ncbi:MAG: helix-turn-helix domain-containing protein [Xanthomonadales bacterium]|nr:helix-turn-helix domain-containing protein [Xanthomonadales bacterium]
MQNKATLAIRDNVQQLMQCHGGMSQRELAKKAGLSQSAVGYLLRYRDVNDRHPTTSTIESVAQVFGLEAWQLMVPNQPIELLLSQQLDAHLTDFLKLNADGRAAVDRITAVEVRVAGAEKTPQQAIQPQTRKAG